MRLELESGSFSASAGYFCRNGFAVSRLALAVAWRAAEVSLAPVRTGFRSRCASDPLSQLCRAHFDAATSRTGQLREPNALVRGLRRIRRLLSSSLLSLVLLLRAGRRTTPPVPQGATPRPRTRRPQPSVVSPVRCLRRQSRAFDGPNGASFKLPDDQFDR